MLNSAATIVIMELVTALRGTNSPQFNELLTKADNLLLATAKTRERMASAATVRHANAKGAPPTVALHVELSPGAAHQCLGVRAAHEILTKELTAIGAKRRVPHLASLKTQLASTGHWHALVETVNGTVSAQVRRG